jgi:hypothetical protein
MLLQGFSRAAMDECQSTVGMSRHPLFRVCEVMSMGAEKYPPHNWRKGFSDSGLVDSALRHLWQHSVEQEQLDPESGLPHMAHFYWNCCALMTQMDQGTGTRDLVP